MRWNVYLSAQEECEFREREREKEIEREKERYTRRNGEKSYRAWAWCALRKVEIWRL